MGNKSPKSISHKRGSENQVVRAVNGLLVECHDRTAIYARDAHQSIKFTRPMGGMRGTYPQWFQFRKRLLSRKTLTMGAIMKLAAHYGVMITAARDFPDIANANFKKEEEPYEKPNATRI